jgi:pimeloyl-ACP methyl ester carboxylesterase
MLVARSWWLLSSLLLTTAACSSEPSAGTGGEGGTSASSGTTGAGGGTGGSGGSGGGAPFQVAVTWKPCPLDSAKSKGTDAECADVVVPADWEDSTGATISVFVKRWPVLASPAKHHLWLVQGGPGGSSAEWDKKLGGPAKSFPDAQFYLQDPRGVGRSTRLGCAVEEDPASEGGIDVTPAEWPSCLADVKAKQGAGLRHFNTTQTAKDLGALVQAISAGTPKITMLGQSYGTTLLQRWLHFYPTQATSVILDSLANPGVTFTHFAEHADAVGHDYLALCAKDADCAAKLGADPVKTAEDAFSTAFDKGGCPALVAAGVDRAALARDLFGLLTLAAYRGLIPPVIHRLARCNAEDVGALQFFNGLFAPGQKPTIVEKLHGTVLYTNIVFGEMWDANPPTPAEHLVALQGLEFGQINVTLDTLFPTWPTYGGDPLASVYPTTALPILMLNGSLDAQTPLVYALDAKGHYTGAHQHFVTVPGAPHGAIGGEAWSQPSAPCSAQILEGFVKDPSAPIDESCFAQADPVSFVTDATATTILFNLTDPWGDAPIPQPLVPPAAVAKAREALRAELSWVRRRH